MTAKIVLPRYIFPLRRQVSAYVRIGQRQREQLTRRAAYTREKTSASWWGLNARHRGSVRAVSSHPRQEEIGIGGWVEFEMTENGFSY